MGKVLCLSAAPQGRAVASTSAIYHSAALRHEKAPTTRGGLWPSCDYLELEAAGLDFKPFEHKSHQIGASNFGMFRHPAQISCFSRNFAVSFKSASEMHTKPSG